ncbi:MAG: molybdenum cofactor guanylyltransferase [Candidatus Planktophila sp.]|nr:molybdenum cofactor guanylyltransferase [Candidatus Planktophila sp.]
MQSNSASVIILTGGTSKRFGSDKSQAKIGGVSLIERILASIPSEFETIIVGPDPMILKADYRTVQEHPIGGGPLAGFKAGLELCTSEIVVLIATDMPFALSRTLHLMESMKPHDDAVIYADAEGFKQSLAAIYRVEAVERALSLMGNAHGQSMQTMLSHLHIREIEMSKEVALAFSDIDTTEDLERAIAFASHMKDGL